MSQIKPYRMVFVYDLLKKNVANHTFENKFVHGIIKILSTLIFAWKPSLNGKNFFGDAIQQSKLGGVIYIGENQVV